MNRGKNKDNSSAKKWNLAVPPARILIVRLHAIGDVAITLPICAAIKRQFPSSRIDFLTSVSCAALPGALETFDTVYQLPESPSRLHRLLSAIRFGIFLRKSEYDLILDLQHNYVSSIIRTICTPKSWGEFDRYAPASSAERILKASQYAGLPITTPVFQLPVRQMLMRDAELRLRKTGWKPGTSLVVLNPAGLFETRNWPMERFLELARSWARREPTCFLFLGTNRVENKAEMFAAQFDGETINFVNQTTLGEALAMLQFVTLVISEDSGLLHMAWASGIPTVALFGSTNHVWASQPGPHIRAFHSGDLECGACMSSTCRLGDTRCLHRITPQQVEAAASGLLHTAP